MWVFFIMNILLLQGLTSAEYFCDKIPTEYCNKENITSELPNDYHELNAMCRKYVKYVDCLQLYEANCPDALLIFFYKPGDSSLMYKLIKEICENDSRIYTALGDHVSCIKATLESHVEGCKVISESKSDDYFAFLREELKNDGLDLKTVFSDYFVLPPCLEMSYSSSCVLHKIEISCGVSAFEVSTELFQSSSMLLEFCSFEDFTKIGKGFVDFIKHSQESGILQRILSSSEFFNAKAQLKDW